jgi:hypothetical protein
MDNKELAKVLVETLRFHAVNPANEFVAAAGPDYGHLESWGIKGVEGFQFVLCRRQAGRADYYAFANDVSDPANWLLYGEQVYPMERLLNFANVMGYQALLREAVRETFDECCCVIKTRSYYPDTEVSSYVVGDDGEPQEWAGADEALAWIEAQARAACQLDELETGRPSYTIVAPH